MNQTKLGSFIEALINTFIGFGVGLASQLLIFPLVGVDIPLSTNMNIAAWFTVISVGRGYVIRRYFNASLHSSAQRLARSIAEN